MILKIDFHVHSKASKDGVSSIEEIVAVARRKGLDGVAITDHDFPMKQGDAERVTSEGGPIVIPGIEISTLSGHVILLCPGEGHLKDTEIGEVIESAKAWGSVVIIPHPVDPFSHGIGEDAVRSIRHVHPILEVINASTFLLYNRRAGKLAKELSLNEVGGSDAHVASAVGSAFTLVEAEDRSVEGVVRALKEGKTRACGGHIPITSLIELSMRRFSRLL